MGETTPIPDKATLADWTDETALADATCCAPILRQYVHVDVARRLGRHGYRKANSPIGVYD
jgi:hypothetical protein